jgi:hypothetical protein
MKSLSVKHEDDFLKTKQKENSLFFSLSWFFLDYLS